MTKRNLPANASVATTGEGAKLIAPAASRNVDALCELIARFSPGHGLALEIASGTGQHVAAFAQIKTDLHWQPSEIEPDRIRSIDAYTNGRANIERAVHLDATIPGWAAQFPGQDLIVLVNLLHLISLPETQTLISEAAKALTPGGRFILYGPFMRDGVLTSEGDARFHASLTEQDSEIGYKDDTQIQTLMGTSGLDVIEAVDMPANNLALIASKPV